MEKQGKLRLNARFETSNTTVDCLPYGPFCPELEKS